MGADEEGVALNLERLNVAAQDPLPLAGSGVGERPHRVAVAVVVGRSRCSGKDRRTIGADRKRLHAFRRANRVPRGANGAGCCVEASDVVLGVGQHAAEVAADVEVVASQLEVEDRAVGRRVPVGVGCASVCVQLDEVRRESASDEIETTAHVHAGAVDDDRLDLLVRAGVEGRVELTGESIDLRDAIARHAVNRAEDAADVEVLAVGGEGDGVDLGGSARDDGSEVGIETSRVDVNGRDVGLGLAVDLGELATDVVPAVGFEEGPHRRGVGGERILAGVDGECRDRALCRYRRAIRYREQRSEECERKNAAHHKRWQALRCNHDGLTSKGHYKPA